MALQIVWTPESKLQLNEILKYWELRNDSLLYSKKLYKIIKNALIVLSKYPESGKISENKKVKIKIIKGYYLFYSFDKEKLSVIGFCDMRRDPNFVESIIIKKV